MNRILNINALLLTNHLMSFGLSYSILEHPDMPEYYLKVRRNPGSPWKQSQRNYILKPEDRAEILIRCKAIADKNVFRLIEPYEPMNEKAVVPTNTLTTDQVMKYFESQGDILAEVTLQVPGIEGIITVFQCAEIKDKIVYIEHIRQYDIFIFEKSKTENTIIIKMAIYKHRSQLIWTTKKRLLEVLEYNSSRGRRIMGYNKQLGFNEREFIKGLEVSGRIQQNNDICKIKNFDLVRLCITVYYKFIKWSTGEREYKLQQPVLLYELRRPSDVVSCKILPISLFVTSYGPIVKVGGHKFVKVTAVPCALNSEWSAPNFYITVGNYKFRPYIIEKFGENYYVTMKLQRLGIFHEIFQEEQSNCLEDSYPA